MVVPVQEGVFFRTPAPLPRGRHSMARDEVVLAQRERLMVAMTELMADRGFDAVRVGDLAARAGVSRAAFYTSFDDLEACAFAAYDRFIDVLLSQVIAGLVPDADTPTFVQGALLGYLRPLQQDPVAARAFQVEMDSVGRRARERRREALKMFAGVIREHNLQQAQTDTTLRPLDPAAYLAIVYGVRQLASDALDREPEPDLTAMVPALTTWMVQAFRG